MIYLIPIISFLGLILGNLFYYNTKEEIWYSKFYFMVLQLVCLLSIIGVLVYNFEFNWLLLVGFLVGLVLAEVVSLWFFLGLSLLIGYFVSNLFLISSLIFVYGLPTGTLMRRVVLEKFLELFLVFIIPLFLYFTIDYVGYEVFLGVVVGGVLRNCTDFCYRLRSLFIL